LGSIALRSAGLYVRARRADENNIFSPTQSFTRLTSSSAGRRALPPSQPHAATRGAVAAPTASFRNPRRSVALVMAREPPAVPAGDDRPERGWVHGEDQDQIGRASCR